MFIACLQAVFQSLPEETEENNGRTSVMIHGHRGEIQTWDLQNMKQVFVWRVLSSEI
jgi:hypothetical protein